MLSSLFDLELLKRHKVIYFRSSDYPVNFFKLFFQTLKTKSKINITSMPIDKIANWQSAKGSLEVSFLGSSSFYWFNKLGLDTKNRKKVYEYLAKYTGPHTVFLFIDNKDILPRHNGVEIPLDLKSNQIADEMVKLLASGNNNYRVSQFVKQIQKDFGRLTVDQVCLLMQYGSLVKDTEEFKNTWVNKIITPEQSLFDLSKHFLFRDSAQFYKSWSLVSDSYAPQFWIAFLSDQLFKAYYFCWYQKQKDYRLAKQISFRLPFDFIKSGWRYADLDLIKKSHTLLYKADYYLKNGGSDIWLELFLNTYLNGSVN